MSVIGVGVFLTDAEVNELREVQARPIIKLPRLGWPETVEEALYRIALTKGLPEIPGYYGLDQSKTPPEITKWVDAGERTAGRPQ